MTGKAIIISAPSGAGKTTIIQRVMRQIPTLEFSVSACTRPPRSGEKTGADYHFLSIDAFRHHMANGDFIEWEEVYPDLFYGTLKSELERIWTLRKTPLFEVDIQGGLTLKNYFGNQALSVFIRPPNLETLKNRLLLRGTEDESSLSKRVGKAALELTYANRFDRVVINRILDKAVSETVNLITSFLHPEIF